MRCVWKVKRVATREGSQDARSNKPRVCFLFPQHLSTSRRAAQIGLASTQVGHHLGRNQISKYSEKLLSKGYIYSSSFGLKSRCLWPRNSSVSLCLGSWCDMSDNVVKASWDSIPVELLQ